MHTVSAELKKRVNDRIDWCAKKLGVNLPTPSIKYDINSARIAGTAQYSTNTIRLNPVFLNAHTEQFIKQTVAHEYAHLAAQKKYGAFIEAHGAEWKREMRNLGIPPSRCHQYTVPKGVKAGKQTVKFDLVCAKCNTVMQVGAKTRNNILTGRSSYTHSKCGGKLSLGKAKAAVAVAPVKAPAAPKAPAGTQSKLAKCFAIYKTYKHTYDRATMIYTFVQEAGCTDLGAATYYSKVKAMDV